MIILILLALGALSIVALRLWRGSAQVQAARGRSGGGTLYDLKARSLEGELVDLGRYRGQVALVVNLASRCGFTPQYEGLETLHRELGPRGLVVLGFPSNDFMNQEPGSADEIRSFCSTRYGVSFPLFEKVQVRGADRHEVYRFLTEQLAQPSWNFTKYLVDRSGHVRYRLGPRVRPEAAELRRRIEELLAGG